MARHDASCGKAQRCQLLAGCAALGDRSVGNSSNDIVLIVAEDLSPRVGAFGDAVAQTPKYSTP